jgi:preprotein translocase subunit SecD
VTEPGKWIADALREIEGQAQRPRLRIDAVWRAGRRRRMRTIATSVAGTAGAAAAAVLVPLTLISGPAQPVIGPPTSHSARIVLATPLHMRQVHSISGRPCRAGSRGVPSSSGKDCFHLTETGMTVRSVESIRVMHEPGGTYQLDVRFIPADAHKWATIGRRLAGEPNPLCQIAMIVNNRVVESATVQGPITSGATEIAGSNRAQAEHLLQLLEGH